MAKSPIMSSFQLRYIRLNILRMSVSKLSKLLDKAESTVSNYEHGYDGIPDKVSKEVLRLANLSEVPDVNYYIDPVKERDIVDLRDKTSLVSQYIHDLTTNSILAKKALFEGSESRCREP